MKIKDIMSKNVIVGSINHDIYKISNIMKENNIGFLPIVDGNKVVGVITDRDIVVSIISNNDSKISGYLKKPISVDINDSIDCVLTVFKENRIKRVIVNDNGKVAGIISISDILSCDGINCDILNAIKCIFKLDYNKMMIVPKVDDFYL